MCDVKVCNESIK